MHWLIRRRDLAMLIFDAMGLLNGSHTILQMGRAAGRTVSF